MASISGVTLTTEVLYVHRTGIRGKGHSVYRIVESLGGKGYCMGKTSHCQ